MVMNGISHVLDHKNLSKAQRVYFELDAHAYCFIMDALSLEVFYRVIAKEPHINCGRQSTASMVIHPHVKMAKSRRRNMSVTSMTTIW